MAKSRKRLIFYTTEEGGEFRPFWTSAGSSEIISSIRKGIRVSFMNFFLVLPERTLLVNAIMLHNGDVWDRRGKRDFNGSAAGFNSKKYRRKYLYKAVFHDKARRYPSGWHYRQITKSWKKLQNEIIRKPLTGLHIEMEAFENIV